MHNFLRHLKASWNYGRQFPYMEAADTADFWGQEDSAALSIFFGTTTGQKLKARLVNYSMKMAVAACLNPNADKYQNGQAAGITATISAIEAHMEPVQEQEQEAPTGELVYE